MNWNTRNKINILKLRNKFLNLRAEAATELRRELQLLVRVTIIRDCAPENHEFGAF